MRLRAGWGLAVFVVTFAIYLVSQNTVWATDHATSLIQLDYSLWHNHSIVLGKQGVFFPNTVDDFVRNGYFYSGLAPGTAFLALPFAGAGFALAGVYTIFTPVMQLSEAFVAIMAAISAYLVYRISLRYFRKSTAVFLGFAFALSTNAWPLGTFFFQHDVSAALVLLTALLALKSSSSEHRGSLLALCCGLAAGAAFTVDYVNAILLPIMGGFLYVSPKGTWKRSAKAVGVFLIGVLPGLATIGAYNYLAFGNPFLTTEQAYSGTPTFLSGFGTPIYFGLPLDLISPARGLFLFAPIAILGVVGYSKALHSPGLKPQFLLLLAVFLGLLLPYSMWFPADGGIAYGPRFIIPAIAFLVIPCGFVLDGAERWSRRLAFVLFGAGVLINAMGALSSPIAPYDGPWVSPFVAYALPQFLAGTVDAFWARWSLAYVYGLDGVVLAAAVILPLALYWLAHRRESDRRTDIVNTSRP